MASGVMQALETVVLHNVHHNLVCVFGRCSQYSRAWEANRPLENMDGIYSMWSHAGRPPSVNRTAEQCQRADLVSTSCFLLLRYDQNTTKALALHGSQNEVPSHKFTLNFSSCSIIETMTTTTVQTHLPISIRVDQNLGVAINPPVKLVIRINSFIDANLM